MGRHSRRGPAPKDGSADMTARRGRRPGTRFGDRRNTPDQREGTDAAPRQAGVPGGPGTPEDPGVPHLVPPEPPRQRQAPAGRSVEQGAPRCADGTPAHGVQRFPDGTPGRGAPRAAEDAPARGLPRLDDVGSVRGGHPEQHEAGGGWGESVGSGGAGPGVVFPRQRQPEPSRPGRGAGPRQDYLDAFTDISEDAEDAGAPAAGSDQAHPTEGRPARARHAYASGADGVRVPVQRGGGKGRAFTGIAAAAVTTVLAVVVAGQVTAGQDGGAGRSRSASGQARDARTADASTPSAPPSTVALTYDQKMDSKFPISATLKGPGKFDTVPGSDKAPGTGRTYRYRVDIERGLGLDGTLFAEAVQKTLNDDRSWAHGGARTFERVSSGKPDFVITLASPATTAVWCAKSGLDTLEENVSCDSAATERVMINAYRWAQGSKTYGDKIRAYRQMLINHEIGHRLGHGHVTCQKNGELAPVMQQQTKFLDHDGIHCLLNPWPYPKG
ncbi:DUF3152 domain-containing protein [Streptomyces pluripotens]|nr:DUF3152 domain-containing protein [Streptomyces pluripotens]ARP72194.1 hypothetical protein LK06_022075 [Streptomyces pluripotens]